MSTYQNVYPLHAYADNDLVENLGPMGLVLKSTVIPEFNTGVPVNAVAATGILTIADTPHSGGIVIISGVSWTFKTALTEVKATGVFTLADVPHDGDTVTIGPLGYGQIYTFKTALTSTSAENEILIEVSASASLDNLVSAINKTSGGGTKYGSDTVENSYIVAAAGAGDTIDATAKEVGTESNAVLTTATNHGSWGAAHLVNGVDAIANEVLIDGAANSLANLVAAIKGTTGEGTTYSTGTTHLLTVLPVQDTGHVDVAAAIKGTAGNAITTTVDGVTTHLSWNHAHLGGAGGVAGVDGTVAIKYEMYLDVSGTKLWICTATNTIVDANWKYISFTG
jgi:hypothetical protein